MDELTADWLKRHPLPAHASGIDKDGRGRVLVIGGARFVPGALRLTGEAALRAGCGKLQLATVDEAAMQLGVLVPEAAMIVLPAGEDGEIGAGAIERLRPALEHCDCVILGPGMIDADRAAPLVAALLAERREDLAIVLDAAAIDCIDRHPPTNGRIVLTPHHGEMARLTGALAEEIAHDPARAATELSARLGVTTVLKSGETIIAAPDGTNIRYAGGGVGLATGGSGDVLAGIIGGLLARGADPFTASAWAVWLHGAAGQKLGRSIGPLGFLARELIGEIPALMGGTAAD